jgi:4-carboxymuconolactone decarboxylase
MSDYLPDVYVRFRELYPQGAETLDSLGAATESAGPLDGRTQRLVTLATAIGGLAEGAVRSNVRSPLAAGVTPDEIRHVAPRDHHRWLPRRNRQLGLDRGGPSLSVIPQGAAATGAPESRPL